MITLENLTYAWTPDVPILDIASFRADRGEKVFLQGASGSGKSTLLNLVCGVFEASSGSVRVMDQQFDRLKPADRDRVRADGMGVIFQQFNLVPFLSLIENVLLPCQFSKPRRDRVGADEQSRIARAHDLLDQLGLSAEARTGKTVTELSVGQQQRVAAARALIGEPSVIIADEPTSALDHDARNQFIDTLLSQAKDATVLFVSHDPTLAPSFDRHVEMADINRAHSRKVGSQTGGQAA